MTEILRVLILSQGAFSFGITMVVISFYTIRFIQSLSPDYINEREVNYIAWRLREWAEIVEDRTLLAPDPDPDHDGPRHDGASNLARVIWLAEQERKRARGLLPWHVMFISIAHLMLTLFAILEIWERLAESAPPSWRIPYLLISFFLSDAALIFVFRYEHKQVG